MSIVDDLTAIAALPAADAMQFELAEVDETFHHEFGRDEAAWTAFQVAAYNAAIDSVWATAGRCPVCGGDFEGCRCTGGAS